MARKLKVETMQKRTAEHKQLIIEELGYCQRLLGNIIEDVEKMNYKHQYEPNPHYWCKGECDKDDYCGHYAAEHAYKYMDVIRGILSRYVKNRGSYYNEVVRVETDNYVYNKYKVENENYEKLLHDIRMSIDKMMW